MAVEMANLEEEITNLKANLQRQEDIIEQRLRVVSFDWYRTTLILHHRLQEHSHLLSLLDAYVYITLVRAL